MLILLKKNHLKAVVCAILFIIVLTISIYLIPKNHEQTALSWQIAPYTFFIDAGHGGIFPGKVAPDGTMEKDINLSITQYFAQLLQQSGAKVILSRTSDTDLLPYDYNGSLLQKQQKDLFGRTQLAKGTKSDYYLSIHCNSIPAPQWHGAQVFYKPDCPESKALAQALQKSLTDQLKNTTRQALPREDTYIFKHTTMPTVIIECGFLSNEEECHLLKDSFYQQKIAHALFLGISDFLKN